MPAIQNVIVDMEILLKLLTAIILSGLIGIEREIHGRPAGLRTHVLVCFGTTVIVISGSHLAYLFSEILHVGTITMDPGRIAAGIITGIGFIGGGCIIRIGDYVRGLTTAACLWFAASLGIVVGVGMYGLALTATFLSLVILVLFEKVEEHLPKLHYRELHLSFSLDEAPEIESKCNTLFSRTRLRVLRIKRHLNRMHDSGEIIYYLRLRNLNAITDVFKTLSQDKLIKTIDIY